VKAPCAGTSNAFLDALCSKVLDLFTKMFMNGEMVNAEILKEWLFGKIEKKITLMELVGEFNANMESKTCNNNGAVKHIQRLKTILN
jgi:hypothetical protein